MPQKETDPMTERLQLIHDKWCMVFDDTLFVKFLTCPCNRPAMPSSRDR